MKLYQVFIAAVFFRFNFDSLNKNDYLISNECTSLLEKLFKINFTEEERTIMTKINTKDELWYFVRLYNTFKLSGKKFGIDQILDIHFKFHKTEKKDDKQDNSTRIDNDYNKYGNNESKFNNQQEILLEDKNNNNNKSEKIDQNEEKRNIENSKDNSSLEKNNKKNGNNESKINKDNNNKKSEKIDQKEKSKENNYCSIKDMNNNKMNDPKGKKELLNSDKYDKYEKKEEKCSKKKVKKKSSSFKENPNTKNELKSLSKNLKKITLIEDEFDFEKDIDENGKKRKNFMDDNNEDDNDEKRKKIKKKSIDNEEENNSKEVIYISKTSKSRIYQIIKDISTKFNKFQFSDIEIFVDELLSITTETKKVKKILKYPPLFLALIILVIKQEKVVKFDPIEEIKQVHGNEEEDNLQKLIQKNLLFENKKEGFFDYVFINNSKMILRDPTFISLLSQYVKINANGEKYILEKEYKEKKSRMFGDTEYTNYENFKFFVKLQELNESFPSFLSYNWIKVFCISDFKNLVKHEHFKILLKKEIFKYKDSINYQLNQDEKKLLKVVIKKLKEEENENEKNNEKTIMDDNLEEKFQYDSESEEEKKSDKENDFKIEKINSDEKYFDNVDE